MKPRRKHDFSPEDYAKEAISMDDDDFGVPNCDDLSRGYLRYEDIPSPFDFLTKLSYVVEGFIPEGAITLLTSEFGHGKSMLALSIAVHVALGAPFCGLKTMQRPVLIIDNENPVTVVAERLRMFGFEESENFRIWGSWCPQDPPAAAGGWVAAWVKSCAIKPLVIIDTLISEHPGSENDASEVRKHMQGYRMLAALGAAVLVLHHTGKADNAKTYRGSSDIPGSVDVAYNVIASASTSLEYVRLRAFKRRMLTKDRFQFRFGPAGFVSDSQAPLSNEEIMVGLLKANPDVTAKDFEDLARARGIARNQARTFLGRPQVSCTKGSSNRHRYIWREDENDPWN